MSALDILFRIACADTHRRREQIVEAWYFQNANDRLKQGMAEAWVSGDLRGPK